MGKSVGAPHEKHIGRHSEKWEDKHYDDGSKRESNSGSRGPGPRYNPPVNDKDDRGWFQKLIER